MKIDELVQQFREDAIRNLVPAIELAKPYHCNDELSKQLFKFVIGIFRNKRIRHPNDMAMILEDTFTYLDHDLSDYLMLAQYQVVPTIIENEQDPIIEIVFTYDNIGISKLRSSFSSMRLMAVKQEREVS